MLTVAQLKKKLKGIGCVPPLSKNFIPHYKAAQQFLAQNIIPDTKIKAAFFAVTLDEKSSWGWSIGILGLTEDQLFYAASFEQTNSFRFIIFSRKDIQNISIIENKNETGVAGILFQKESVDYEFADVNSNIPSPFLKELVTQQLSNKKIEELTHKLNLLSGKGSDSLLF